MTAAAGDRVDLRGRVDKALAAFLGGQAERLAAVADTLAPVQEAMEQFLLTGGKRLRPAFCYWGFRGAGGEDSDEVVAAAAALELLQACALIHDDVMDGSDTRRGQPAMHLRFAGLHRGGAWLGDPQSFGVSAAILLGDLCLIWADELLGTCGLPLDALQRCARVYDQMRVELMAGQYLDLLEQARGGGDVASALRVARYKSAKYTIEKPLHMGAALAGAGPEVVAAYTAYGLPLGEAFQLRDDVLGVFGDPGQTGKPAGDDLREGKRTALVAMALERSTPVQQGLLRRHLGDPHLDPAGVAALREVIVDTGALDRTEALIADLLGRSQEGLAGAPVDAEAREALAALALAATSRTV